ncbi:gluconate 2-dehydrogenase subunit 3 family protein [Danxiaibacter flavus]|uniref:Gluconate 2-dehydrogenase subunit 3 family protein n=1 Tax=Danxiaibacter flavus TaxID=3049108 RepID=A0ABV3ZLR4_9BACT|nr:gluconate 2-dehydrogenase subunit 3 family protein [Chitinophagaceae bacterium DXS]
MNRRDALSRVALLLGGTIIGAEAFLSGCKNTETKAGVLDFSANNIAFLDEVGETILPTTASSPGAKAAKIGEFMKTIVTDCYPEKDQKVFADTVNKINDAAKKKYNKDFMSLAANEKHDLLVELDKEAKDYNKNKKEGDPNHYFAMVKQLTLWGYFTSEVGATKALRYVPVPGKYEGCIPYKKGDKAWAL